MKTSWIPEIKTQTQQQKDGHWPCIKETHPSHMFDSADLWCFRRRRLRNLQVRSLQGRGNFVYSIDLYCYSRPACAKQVPKNIQKHPKTSKNIKKHRKTLRNTLSSHNMSLHVQTPPLPQVWILLLAALPLWKPRHQSTHRPPLKIIFNCFGMCWEPTAACLSDCKCLRQG